MIKIREGTKSSEVNLCDKCIHYRVRTHDNGVVERQCSVNDERSHWAVIRGSKVVDCSVYHSGAEINLNAMRSIAWQYIVTEDGIITFINQNAMSHPQLATRNPTLWQKIKRVFQ